ncbi:T-cell surface protein tactile isoform X2 [Mesocricetus auratus]|uniref:T-cell surface protein tactile isoform X2 n=1 Tax=Mesocricetus auratus TaxID=10036 RepID=A0A3Q0CZ21_MESAU|nr:T-cell surface protein tactile isoform X2 [Mesocricetus auratus]
MGRKWTYCAVYSIIQIQFFRGVWEEIFKAGEAIYAPPGSDVNLTCRTKEKDFLVQMQWSKVTDTIDLIVVYHPQYGFHCAPRHTCESQVASIETGKNVTKWTLHLRNVSTTFSGKYECSFTVYPGGIQTTVHSLIVAPVIQEERNHTIETETNQTLEIPCFQNTSSEISPGFTFEWLVKKDGVQEVLFPHNDHISNSTSFKGRVKLGADSGLHLSPVQIQDDGKTFSCRLTVNPLKIWKTSTTVKVFAKPEILLIVENSTMDGLGQRAFTCLLKNVFPRANITWLIDGKFLQGDEEGIFITNDEENDRNGFQELKSVLTRTHGNRPAHSNNVTIQCKALSPGPRNKMWSTSSQAITLSLDSVTVPMEYLSSVTGSTLGTQTFPDGSVSPTTGFPVMSSMAIVDGDVTTPDATPQGSNSSTTTQGFNYSQISSETDAKNAVSLIPSERHTLAPSEASLAPHDVITSTTKEFPDVPTTARGTIENEHSHITTWKGPRLSSHHRLPSSTRAFKNPLDVICLVVRWRHCELLSFATQQLVSAVSLKDTLFCINIIASQPCLCCSSSECWK